MRPKHTSKCRVFTASMLALFASSCKKIEKAQSKSQQETHSTISVLQYNILGRSYGSNLHTWFFSIFESDRKNVEVDPKQFSAEIENFLKVKPDPNAGSKMRLPSWVKYCTPAFGTAVPNAKCADPGYQIYQKYPKLVSALIKFDKEVFDWNVRGKKIEQILMKAIEAKTDVITLSETDPVGEFEVFFKNSGYEFVSASRPSSNGWPYEDHVAIAFRIQTLELNQNSVCKVEYKSGGRSDPDGNVGLAVQLKTRDGNRPKTFWVLATHLLKMPEDEANEKRRVEQISQLIGEKCNLGKEPQIISGDFNSTPDKSVAKEFLHQGYKNSILETLPEAYSDNPDGVYPCTSSTPNRRNWIDHIYYKGSALIPLGPLAGFESQRCGKNLEWPSRDVPSDHIPVSMQFKLSDG